MSSARKALLSVYDKTGIVEFAMELIALGWEIISSGGTAKTLREAGIKVTDVAEISGLPPILGHRVVTLVPQIHGGLLATEGQREELEGLGYPWIDLAHIDLYPLEKEIAREGATRESVIELTDIGGPTMIRSAAKGRRIVIADIKDRQTVLGWLKAGEPDSVEFRNNLAARAEGVIAQYCLASARYHSDGRIDGFIGTEVKTLKYGENPWQNPASLFSTSTEDELALDRFPVIDGDAPSFVNLADVDRLLQTITHIEAAFDLNQMPPPYIAVGAKHGNPCGVGAATSTIDAIQKMLVGDPLAIFGGLAMVNFPIDVDEAACLREWDMAGDKKRLFDGVIATSFTPEARSELERKGGKCRMIENPALGRHSATMLDHSPRLRPVRGGFLRQPNYTFVLNLSNPEIECVGEQLPADQKRDLLLAWAIGSTSNSNTITLVKDGMLVGNGVGQQDRVGAASLAVDRARRSGHDTKGAVAYSDSFFPFPDGPQVLITAGVRAILASKGSVNDDQIREVCRQTGVTLYMIPDKFGRGFFGH